MWPVRASIVSQCSGLRSLTTYHSSGPVLPPEQARRITKELYGEQEAVALAVKGRELTLWTPMEDAALGWLLNLYLKLGARHQLRAWCLLVPIDVIDACANMTDFLDIF